jgi:predicted enzyme related to lactoylglutathione lyase
MAEVKEYAPGSFCWAELSTSDAEAAKTFYSELFGWSFFDSEMGPGMVYTLLRSNGKDVAALYQVSEQQRSEGAPSNWLSYVSVTDVDGSVEFAKSLGANVLTGPLDAHDAGRLAVIQDPLGATFALWKANKNIGAMLINQPGTMCWNELVTSNSLAGGEFYAKLFNWGKQVQQMGSMEYTIFVNGDRPAGGMYQITPEMGNVAPHWLVYFAVDDCENSVDRATRMGAKVCLPAQDIPEVGRFSILSDPQGAAFAVIKLLNL